MTNVTQAAKEAARERMAVAYEAKNAPNTARHYREGEYDDELQPFSLALQEISDAIEAGDTSAFVLAKDVDPVLLAARKMLSERNPKCTVSIMNGGWAVAEKSICAAIRRGIAMAKAGEA